MRDESNGTIYESSRARQESILWLLLALGAIALVPYLNILPNQFTYDDKIIFVENLNFPKLRDISNFFRHAYFDYAREQSYRPIVSLTYLVDYLLWGIQKPPWGYHLTNMLLNVAAVIATFFLARRLSGNVWIAFFAATIFSLHPIHTEPTNSIGFREDLLVAVFYFLSFYFYSAGGEKRNTAHALLSNACYAAALLSKEMALSLPIVLITYDIMFRRERLKSWRALLGRYLPYLIITILYGLVRFWWLRFQSPNPPHWVGYNFWTNALTMISVLGYYVRLLFIPTPLQIEYNYPPVASASDPRFLLGVAVLCPLIALGFYLRRRAPLIAFACLFFFITLIPVLNIVPLRYFIAERHLYLPSFGFALGMAFLLTRIGNRTMELLILSIVGAIFGMIIVVRNAEWKDNHTLCQATLARNPQSKKAHYGMGVYYYSNGVYDKAIQEFETALHIDPGYTPPRLYLGAVYFVTHRYDDAIRENALVARIAPDDSRAYENLGLAYRNKGLLDQAIAAHEKAVSLEPDNWSYHKDLAIAYMEKGEFDKSRAELERAMRLNPQELRLRDLIRLNEERRARGKP
jgi:tetratricopeptide (TPR) repeat protein